MEIYNDGFGDWNDVKREFRIEQDEPEKVLYAVYDNGGWEGSALVVYKQGNKYYWVEGSHCSCYGLEDQFIPEEYTFTEFMEVLKRKIDAWTSDSRYYGLDTKEVLEFIKTSVLYK